MAGSAPAPVPGTPAAAPISAPAANEVAIAPATASKAQPADSRPKPAEPPKSDADTRTVTTMRGVSYGEPMIGNDGNPLTKQVTINGVTMTVPATKSVHKRAGEVITLPKGDADEMISRGFARLTDPTLD